MKTNGEAIKARRKALFLRQDELAKICSIARETLSRVETGKAPWPEYAETILQLIERDPGALAHVMYLRCRDDEAS